MNKEQLLLLTLSLFLLTSLASADEVYLKNKDRISGKIISEDGRSVVVETESMGVVTIKREFLRRIESGEQIQVVEEKPEVQWTREVSLGYNKSSGNTQNSQLATKLSIHRKTDDNEFHLQGDTHYSSSNKKMDAQRWNLMSRYAFSFGIRKWYNFYKLEANHDRFANIDYRVIPSTGVGYWFSDAEDFKAMSELGLGLEYTNYPDQTKDETEPVLIPRAFVEKRIWGQSRISEDLFLYPSLEDTGDYRLHSETVFSNPINDALTLELSLINDYDSDPPTNIKKHDTRLISSLVYSF
ncbi:MAG: DUF481 domain-containing protein [Candidatus Omnitrophica bacterium]|nr:DUF481 domain-containing protein [Candidatus Omnitrophota bacterium]